MTRTLHKQPWLAGGVLLWMILLVQPPDSTAHSRSSTTLLSKAKACQTKLVNSRKLVKYRDQWERCVALYQNVIESRGTHRTKEEAYFQVAQLRLGLSRYSGRSRDYEAAERAAGALKKRYPRSRYVNQIEAALAKNRNASAKTPPPRAKLQNVRYWSHPDYTRVVFDLSEKVDYQELQKSGPAQLLIDLSGTRLKKGFDQALISVNDGVLRQVRAVQRTADTVRVSLLLGQPTHYRVLNFTNPDRVVVDVYSKTAESAVPVPKPSPFDRISRVMIDPGHGGKDPGAIGRRGLTEKEVVLDVSLRLQELIRKRLNKEVMLTRDRDVFLPLQERTQLANQKKADLFISVHANAAPDRRAHGVEIYSLGQATDSSALATAARENSIEEESLRDLDGAIRVMLADLSIAKRVDYSLEFADMTRRSFLLTLPPQYQIADLGVKQAPFYVLMNAGMPSILAEISFISNPQEEKLLGTRAYRAKIAEALFKGVQRYIQKYDLHAKLENVKTSN